MINDKYRPRFLRHLIKKLTLPNTSYITNVFDDNARWKRTTLFNSSNTELNDHEYVYNLGNQRTKHTRTDDSYNTYAYDDAGQLWTVRTTNSVGTEVTTEKFGYLIDAGYNIATVTNNASTTSYTINNLNQNTSNYSFDSNGNPSSGSPAPWTFTFDDENRLTVATLTGTSKSEFYYDARSRLRKRLEYNWVSNAWSLSTETRYVYDGMLAVQHRNGSDVPSETYTRGPDLSGTFEGAGGIGGMRARTTSYNSGTGTWTTHHFYQSDANGNNTYLVNSSQTLAGKYTFDPHGNLLSSSGLFASSNPYRFSSKELHTKTGFYYFLYRFKDPVNGRWLNRDPIGEEGGFNLYGFASNDPIGQIDPLGLKKPKPGVGMTEVTIAGIAPGECKLTGAEEYTDCEGKCQYKVCVYKCVPPRYNDMIQWYWFEAFKYPGCGGSCGLMDYDTAQKQAPPVMKGGPPKLK